MTVIQTSAIVVPSDPATQKRIKDALHEASAAMTRIEGERDFLKELIADLSKDTELPKPYLNKISRLYHKHNFSEVTADQEAVQELYEKIFGAED